MGCWEIWPRPLHRAPHGGGAEKITQEQGTTIYFTSYWLPEMSEQFAVVHKCSGHLATGADPLSAPTSIRIGKKDRLPPTGTKLVCGSGVGGACTVLLDGTPVASCLLPAQAAAGKR